MKINNLGDILKYMCYVDESNHDRRIRYIEEKGKFNFELEKFNNEFIVVNTLVKKDLVRKVYEELLEFRVKYNYSESTELKGQNFYQGTKKNKQFKYGFSDFTKDNISRFSDFLDIIEKNEIINNISFKNKKSNFHKPLMDYMIESNLDITNVPIYANCLATLDLVLEQLDASNIYKKISENKLYEAHRELLKKMKKFRQTEFETLSEGENKRIKAHKKAMKDLSTHFPHSNSVYSSTFNEKWEYETGVKGLFNDLKFRKISENDVEVIVDDEHNMNKVYGKKFSNVNSCSSGNNENKDSLLLSIPDVIAYNFNILNENIMTSITNKQFNEKLLLEPKFFELNENQYILVKKINSTLLKHGEKDFYSTYSYITSKSLQYVIAYIKVIAGYETFSQYMENTEKMPEQTNTCVTVMRKYLYLML